MFVFAVSGADTENVFDPGLPVGTHCPALDEFGNPEAMYTGSACTVSFGSYDPHDLLFEMTMINDASFCTAGPASSSDWTLVDASSSGWSEVNILTSNGTHSFSCDLQHEPVIELVDGIQGAVKEA
jgi:hypothetical protein